MGDELPHTLYNSDPPKPPLPPKPPALSNFLEAHGTVVLLFALVIVAFLATFYLALHLKQLDAKEVFAYFSGFCTGAFSTMALGMKVGNGTKS